MRDPMPALSALYCYPVKSCRGIALKEALLDERGIVHDREFMIVDAEKSPNHATRHACDGVDHDCGCQGRLALGFPPPWRN